MSVEVITKTETITREVTEARAVICDACGQRTLLTLNQSVGDDGCVEWSLDLDRRNLILIRRVSGRDDRPNREVFHVCPSCWDNKVRPLFSMEAALTD